MPAVSRGVFGGRFCKLNFSLEAQAKSHSGEGCSTENSHISLVLSTLVHYQLCFIVELSLSKPYAWVPWWFRSGIYYLHHSSFLEFMSFSQGAECTGNVCVAGTGLSTEHELETCLGNKPRNSTKLRTDIASWNLDVPCTKKWFHQVLGGITLLKKALVLDSFLGYRRKTKQGGTIKNSLFSAYTSDSIENMLIERAQTCVPALCPSHLLSFF